MSLSVTRQHRVKAFIGLQLKRAIGLSLAFVTGLSRMLLADWKICVGNDPDRVSAPALIFFPCRSNVLCCGLAGIVTVKPPGPSDSRGTGMRMQSLFAAMRLNNLAGILDGVTVPEHYLDGSESLAGLEQCISILKLNEAFERIFYDQEEKAALEALTNEMTAFLDEEEALIEGRAAFLSTHDLEIINSRLTRMKDICWALGRDILDNVGKILSLADSASPDDLPPEAFRKYREINFLLNCLDRLEVRGRDSAGILIAFAPNAPGELADIIERLRQSGLYDEFRRRAAAGDLINGSIEYSEFPPRISFTYKTASIIGELGRNIRELRKSVKRDVVFREFARTEAVFETTLSHTRWASVGAITEVNCHPINNYTLNGSKPRYPLYGEGNRMISVVLNGDIDNYEILRRSYENGRELLAPEVTTDTKIIPLQIEKYLLAGNDLAESFRRAVCDFEGSHAIAMTSSLEPSRTFLALRGSGQSIYVGLAPDRYIFSSELYGLVEETPFFIRMDGEKQRLPDDPASVGQILILDQNSQGGPAGIRSFHYNGMPIDWQETDIQQAEITTRDIDRGSYPHFYLKEISESTLSVHKTLLGKYRISTETGGKKQVRFNLGPDVVPEKVLLALRRGEIRRVSIIGHGTAAVAGAAVADALERYLAGAGIRIEAKIASELSGFSLNANLQDTLIIPITQSGTTTDTNRAVAMAAQRGAAIIAIVNRRQSDITNKSDGVFYTSDGRDIEMSVASTKAFYSQIVAGHILSLYLAQLLGTLSDDRIAVELENLERAPDLMQQVLEQTENIRRSVWKCAVQKKYWAVVGSGPNKAAADEIRIKLSELCYKTISSDVVENKKHIDLSAEPLIIVCAAGAPETVAGDILKDTAIFKAHKAGVVVFADQGETGYDAVADTVIAIPRARQPLPVILNTVAGHLWGYWAACRIDEEALFFREFRSRLNLTVAETGRQPGSFYEKIADRQFRKMIRDFSTALQERLAGGGFSLSGVGTISELVLLLKYAVGKIPLEDFWQDFKDETLSPIDRLDICLGHAIDELSRPIDTIRHQAKTVTVGTSRKEKPMEGIIFALLQELSISLRQIIGKNILAIRNMQPAVAVIKGYTLYAVDNLDPEGNPQDATTIAIRQRGGIAMQMQSRAERQNLLMGAKKTIVGMGNVYLGRGKSDAAPIMIIPLLGEGPGVRNLLLIHIRYNESLNLSEKIAVLGYRFNDLRNLINEYNLPWDDRYLESISLESLFSEPVEIIAGQIREKLET
jgi:glucosamine--fructose-6-phosphate aminotransferase (isomerizing)